MKHKLRSIFLMLLPLTLLTACDSSASSAAQKSDLQSDHLSVVCTIFPEYDWVREILGDNPADIELTMLLDNGVDLHSFQPTAEDLMKIADCDLFVYVGGESDAWVEDALPGNANPDRIVLDLLDILGDSAKEEELAEGMQSEPESDAAGDLDEEVEYDEHVWLSLRNAQVLCQALTDALSEIDPENEALYKKNLADYQGKLQTLDEAYGRTTADGAVHTLVFGDRFPFRYLTDDYDLDYYAAFAGCSAETEASFETILFLAGKVDELSLPAVMTIEGTDHRIAETIAENTSSQAPEILTMDSMQSTTSKDVEAGASYLAIMEDNLAVLSEALE